MRPGSTNPSVLKFVDDVADAVGAGEGDLGDLGTGMPWAASIVLLSGSLTQQGEL
jgi:hypothetical protein